MIDAGTVAAGLAAAERERRARGPFTDAHPDLDEATAYEAQWLGVRARVAAGDRIVGAKLGLTSPVKQKVMNVDAPLYGWVTASMILAGDGPVPVDRFIHPRVEPEIAFRLATDVPTPATVDGVLAATAAVHAAIDVLDSRYADFRFRLPDVVADNASAAGFLLGNLAVAADDAGDLAALTCRLRVDGTVVETATGAASMGHPAAAVAWLADRLAARGQVLTAGLVVFSGGLTEPVPLTPGVVVTAEFGGGLGTVEAHTL